MKRLTLLVILFGLTACSYHQCVGWEIGNTQKTSTCSCCHESQEENQDEEM